MIKSEELFKKAQNIMPGGVNSPVRAFNAVKKTPFFVDKAQGAYLYDVDGNKYIDYVCSWGPGILENAYKQIGLQTKRVGSLLSVFFTDIPISNYNDVSTCDVNKFADYFNYMLSNGIYVAPSQFESMFVSFAHTDEIIEKTADVILKYNK